VVVAGKFILKVSTRSDSGWCGAQTWKEKIRVSFV
jgi:hypothetical protein